MTAEHTELRDRAAAGFTWKLLSTLSSTAVQFALGVVLARLLAPEDFGLLGLAVIVTGFGNLFVTLGMGPALIQRRELDPRHVRVAFTVSVGVGLGLTAVTWAAAPGLATFLRDDRVIEILRVLALGFAVAGVGTVSQALLARRLAFKPLFVMEMVATLGSGVLGIAMAWWGFGVWSLVFSNLLRKLLEASVAYTFSGHTLVPLLARRELRELSGFGAGISLGQIFNYIALQGDYFVVGRLLGPAALGFYTRAYTLMTLPTSRFVQALGSVLFPVASRIQDDLPRLGEAYRFAVSVMALATIPALVVLASLAPEIILGIYGPKWEPAIAPLQILAAFGAFRALYNGTANFVRARGWVYRILVCQILYCATALGGAWLAAEPWGIVGVAWAIGLAILLMWFAMSYLGNRATQTSLASFAATLAPGILIGGIAGIGCNATKAALVWAGAGPLGVLVAALLAAGLASLAGLALLPQNLLAHLPHRLLSSFERIVPRSGRRRFARLLHRFPAGQGAASAGSSLSKT